MRKRHAKLFLGGLAMAVLFKAGICLGAAPDLYASFQAAHELEREGKTMEAFVKYLAVPGGEHAALSVARPNPQKFLALLQKDQRLLELPRGPLLEAELLLITGQKEQARQRYGKLADVAKNNWGTDQESYYPVEPRGRRDNEEYMASFYSSQPAQPFSYGPGSHRDNWLLRRLIAFDMTEEAAREFARMWEAHRANTRPYVVAVPHYDQEKKQYSGEDKYWVRPCGFNSVGLQFALDYGFFLKRSGRTNEALALLLEPLGRMDMDCNPNIEHRDPLPATEWEVKPRAPAYSRHGFGAGSVGVSRKEYIRLVHGEYKMAGQETKLLGDIEKEIAGGDNRARRVLAQIRLHQGQPDAAIKLELEYIAQGDFDELTSTYRRGLVFEEYKKTAEAIKELEKTLALKPGPMRLPDYEEQISEHAFMQASAFIQQDFVVPNQQAYARQAVQEKLLRLYSAAGMADKALALQLEQFNSEEVRLNNLDQIEQLAQRCKAAGQEALFKEWARKKMVEAKSPLARANLAWQQNEYNVAMTNAAAAVAEGKYYDREPWKEKFRKLGRKELEQFLQMVVQANPKDSISRLELLDLQDRLEGQEAIAALELLLATDANEAFPRGKGSWNRTRFKNYLDLAYRLMRLYEKNGQTDKLLALGLRIAQGEKPFDKYDSNLYFSVSENGKEEWGNACLALTLQYANTKVLATLQKALENTPWLPAKAQLARRLEPLAAGKPPKGPVVAWPGVPENVTLIASAENVLSLAADERYVYVGQPWGLSVYDHAGSTVARVALGEAVRALAPAGSVVWAGTPAGLFRVSREQWSTEQFAMDCINQLVLDKEDLWIAHRQGISVLNTRTLEMRQFSMAELKLTHPGDFREIVLDRDYVWANGNEGLRQYERRTGQWRKPEDVGERYPVNFIALVDGRVFADVWLNDTLRHRPALVESRTLKVTPILLEPDLPRDKQLINQELQYFGKWEGQLVFAGGGTIWVYDEEAGKLRPISALMEKFWEEVRIANKADTLHPILQPGKKAYVTSLQYEKMFGKAHADDWLQLKLPNGTRVFGSQSTRIRFEYPHEDWPESNGDLAETAGGLFFVTDAGSVRRVSSEPEGQTLRTDSVFTLLPDTAGKRDWVCTPGGLAWLGADELIHAKFSRAEGLGANYVSGGVELDGSFYFASGWGHAGGGLLCFDPRTQIFTSYHRSDGLDADKVESVEVDGKRLKLNFGIEYQYLNGGEYRRCPPGWFSPGDRQFTSGGPAEISRSELPGYRQKQPARAPAPFLGGFVMQQIEKDGKTFICGTRGLVIAKGPVAKPSFKSLSITVVTDPAQSLLAEAEAVRIPQPVSLELLQQLLTSTNGYIRANALAAAMDPIYKNLPGFPATIGPCVTDAVYQVRATATWLLSRSKDESVIAPLQTALQDSDRYIRAVAALALARRGQRPSVSYFEEIVQAKEGTYGNFAYGAKSSIGVEAGTVWAWKALAPVMDRELFALAMKYPPPMNHTDILDLLPKFGEGLRRHPEAAELLLAAQDESTWGNRLMFARGVLKHAGKELLPVLHKALASKDRVVRSNAARGCGGIGDPSSIPHLLQALDMESGLARASIVWALGELKAKEALPKLVDLYTDARNAEHNRRASAGFMAQQAFAAHRAQYTELRQLDAIASDWDEVKAAAAPRVLNPRTQEELLTAAHVLEAVRKIGPESAQEFYRALAGGKEAEDRAEAAVGLAEASGAEREKNRSILRLLQSDPGPEVRIRAAVSLLVLGETGVEEKLRQELVKGENSERGEVLLQLPRLKPDQIKAFRKELEAIANNQQEGQYLRERASAVLAKAR